MTGLWHHLLICAVALLSWTSPATASPPTRLADSTTSMQAMTDDEKTALRVAIAQCWNAGATSPDITVTVAVTLDRGGVPDAGSIRLVAFTGGNDAAAQEAFTMARRAIVRCGAAGGYDLPALKYDAWKELELTFGPAGMALS